MILSIFWGKTKDCKIHVDTHTDWCALNEAKS